MKTFTHKLVAVAVGTAGMLLFTAPAAFAGGGYGSQPGFSVSNANTVCAGHGSFGAFGNSGDVVHDFGINNLGSNGAPGAANWQNPGTGGGTTGGNNSSLCGNGASPPPFTP
jgi:hypothetical protein